MAIARDAVSSGSGTSGSATFAHTTGSGADRLLVVAVGISGTANISGVTYGGTALTFLDYADGAGATSRRVELWYLKNPPTGTANIVATRSSSTIIAVAGTYTGVDQTTPFGTTGIHQNTTNATSSSTGLTGGHATDLVISGLYVETPDTDDPVAGGSQSLVARVHRSSFECVTLTDQAGGTGTITSGFSWTNSSRSGQVSVPLEEAPPSPQTIPIGQAVETDTAQPITTAAVIGTLTQPSETDTAQTIRPALAAMIGRASETDTAQLVGANDGVRIGQAAETDTAQSITGVQYQQVTSVITNDEDAWTVPLEWSCVIDLEDTATDDADTSTDAANGVQFIQRASITMPSPTLVDGLPVNWQPTSVLRTDWRRLHLTIGGVSVTRLRGKRFIPLTTAWQEPFSDAEASFALPGLTDFDNLADFGINRLDPVRLRGRDSDGDWHVLYEGEFASREGAQPNGQGVIIQCIGALFRMNLLRLAPALVQEKKDLGRIIAHAFNDKVRNFALHVGHMAVVDTGIDDVTPTGDFPQLLDGIQDLLSRATTDDGGQWTVRVQRPRTPKLVLKDLETVNYTIHHGAPGVDTSGLSKDYTTGTTAGYASGSNGHCTWMGARFPNQPQEDPPDFPLSVGETFVAGDSQTGFAPFAAFLRRGQYGTIVSDDTYDTRDVDNVTQFQDRAGVTADGIVGGQTWTAAFQAGRNENAERGAYVDTIWERTETRKRLYNAQGADIGRNPDFDPTTPRIEDYIPFGDNVSKNDGRKSVRQTVFRAHPVGVFGTIVLTSDPEEGSRFAIRDGDNIQLRHFHGGEVLLHVTRNTVDWQTGTATLTVDEKARDILTLGAIRQRRRDVSDLTRRQQFGRTRSKVFDDYGTWLCEDGAGEIPLMVQQGGLWNVQRIAAAPKGTIARISLALGTGLTEHLLNVNLSDNPHATIPGAGRGAMAIFAKPVTANALANLLGNPVLLDSNDENPWDRESDDLQRRGMIFAAGGPGAQIGFYPYDDPGDGSDTHLSGRFEDAGGVDFGPTGHYWLWVAVYSTASCKVGGRIYPGAP